MRETKHIEYKSEFTKTFLKTVSAYANYGAGEIHFGKADDGSIIGVKDAKQLCLDIENSINDSITPVPQYALDVINKNDKQVVILSVFEGYSKPYLYRGKAYRRSDTADVAVDIIELNRLTLAGQNIGYDEIACIKQDLTFTILERDLQDRLGVRALDDDVMRTLGLYSNKYGYNNAAAVFADANDFTGIDIVKYGGDITEIEDRERFIGVSILEQLRGAMNLFHKYYQYEKIDALQRKDIERIPEVAFREALVNALAHRHWDSKANVQIEMRRDAIEITSPGALPPEISWGEYMSGHVSIPRNKVIAGVLFRLGYIELFGSGIGRIRRAYEGRRQAPVFSASENLLKIVLPVFNSGEPLNADQMRALEIFKDAQALSRPELEQAMGISQSKAGRILNSLLDKGLLIKTGESRKTKYILAQG
jgi:ATP-dependent DNA helicase RecG